MNGRSRTKLAADMIIAMEQCVSRMTDECLIRAAVKGQDAAFDEVVRRYCKPLVGFAASRTAAFQDAEDIAQETFFRALQHLSSYDERYSFKSWLFTIAYRLIVSEYRKKRPERLSSQVAEGLEDKRGSKSTEHAWVWQAAGGLSEDDYSILWLRYKQDMTIPEMARVMGKSSLAVRVRLHRARKRLGELIDDSSEHCVGRISLKGKD